jgi:bromodomain-containing factor 1
MTLDQIKYCGAIMRNLKKHRDAAPFIHPVDYIKLNIPDYPHIIKRPIDLTTIDKKLKHHDYNHVNQFVDDIRLLFNNCYKFNGPEATVSMLCQNVESAFEKSLRQMPPSKQPNESSSPAQQHPATSLPPGITPSFRRITEDNKPLHPPHSSDYLPKRRTGSQNGIKPPSSTNRQLKFCSQVLREMKKIKYRAFSYPFLLPVDAVALNLPDYHTIITHPMDLSTIEQNLARGEYNSPLDFESDVRLMFANCYRYNPPTLPIHKMAKDLERIFDEKWKQLPPETPARKPDSSSSSDEGSDDAHDGKSSTRSFSYLPPSILSTKTKRTGQPHRRTGTSSRLTLAANRNHKVKQTESG